MTAHGKLSKISVRTLGQNSWSGATRTTFQRPKAQDLFFHLQLLLKRRLLRRQASRALSQRFVLLQHQSP